MRQMGQVNMVATVVQWLVPQIVALRTQARILAVAIFYCKHRK